MVDENKKYSMRKRANEDRQELDRKMPCEMSFGAGNDAAALALFSLLDAYRFAQPQERDDG